MKYLILLLLTSISFAQTKITAYRLINEYDDGPCSIKSYVEEFNYNNFDSYLTAESDDVILADKLLKIKRQSKNWKSISFSCEDSMIGGDMINNMFVVENKGKSDTIFTTKGNGYIVFANKKKAYKDDEGIFNNSLTGIIKEFSEHDFDKDFRGMIMGIRDSISADVVLYRSKNIYGYTSDRFEKEFGKLEFIKEEVKHNGVIESRYSFDGNLYTFDNDIISKIEVVKADGKWQFDKQVIGSTQIAQENKYPLSMSFNVIASTDFETYKKENLHWLNIKEQRGSVSFWLKDSKLDRFIVYYSYPKI